MTINELRIKRAKAWEATKAFLDSHRNTDGILSADEANGAVSQQFFQNLTQSGI